MECFTQSDPAALPSPCASPVLGLLPCSHAILPLHLHDTVHICFHYKDPGSLYDFDKNFELTTPGEKIHVFMTTFYIYFHRPVDVLL
jgi:hypothetical protein